jgi:hypothetical protein
MVYNLKAGLMATTTMVGSAVAFTKTQAGVEEQKEKNQTSGQGMTDQQAESWRAGGNQNQGQGTQYKDTFHQMMMWK